MTCAPIAKHAIDEWKKSEFTAVHDAMKTSKKATMNSPPRAFLVVAQSSSLKRHRNRPSKKAYEDCEQCSAAVLPWLPSQGMPDSQQCCRLLNGLSASTPVETACS